MTKEHVKTALQAIVIAGALIGFVFTFGGAQGEFREKLIAQSDRITAHQQWLLSLEDRVRSVERMAADLEWVKRYLQSKGGSP